MFFDCKKKAVQNFYFSWMHSFDNECNFYCIFFFGISGIITHRWTKKFFGCCYYILIFDSQQCKYHIMWKLANINREKYLGGATIDRYYGNGWSLHGGWFRDWYSWAQIMKGCFFLFNLYFFECYCVQGKEMCILFFIFKKNKCSWHRCRIIVTLLSMEWICIWWLIFSFLTFNFVLQLHQKKLGKSYHLICSIFYFSLYTRAVLYW